MRTAIYFIGTIIIWVGTAAAQNTAPSVFSYNLGNGSAEAKSASSHLESAIMKGLFDQFPCVDQMDVDGVRALLDLERQRELLGNPDDQALANIGSSLGAEDIVVVRATAMENGQTYLSVKVLNTKTATAVASRDSAPASGDSLVDNMESLAKQILQDMSAILNGKCTPHWSGTVTFSFKFENKEEKNETSPNGEATNNRSLWQTENFIEAMLRPSGGNDPNISRADVVHRFSHHEEQINTDIRTFPCWPKDGEAYNKKITNRESTIVTERGEARVKELVTVNIDRSDGTYTISVASPSVKSTSHREYNSTGLGCFDAKPISAISDGEGLPESSTYRDESTEEVKGKVDSKNPDVLSGTTTTGDQASGILTVTWNLRFVKLRSPR